MRYRPFFDCEEDKFITERNDIVRAQKVPQAGV